MRNDCLTDLALGTLVPCRIPRLSIKHQVEYSKISKCDKWVMTLTFKEQAPVVQRLDNAIHWINRYPADKCWQKNQAIRWIGLSTFEQPGPNRFLHGKQFLLWIFLFSSTVHQNRSVLDRIEKSLESFSYAGFKYLFLVLYPLSVTPKNPEINQRNV